MYSIPWSLLIHLGSARWKTKINLNYLAKKAWLLSLWIVSFFSLFTFMTRIVMRHTRISSAVSTSVATVLTSSLFSAVTGVTACVLSLPLSKIYTSERVFTLCSPTCKSCSHKKSSSFKSEKINIPVINQRDSGLISESVLIVLLSYLFANFSSLLHLQSLVRHLSDWNTSVYVEQ